MSQPTLRLLIPSIALTLACSSGSVLETRHAAGRRPLGGQRTLVIADVDEKSRVATEDAAVKELPGAVAAHGLAGAPTVATLGTLAGSQWDAIVVLSYSGSRMKLLPAVDKAPGGLLVTLDLDVSVRAASDLKELWGEKVRYSETIPRIVLPPEEDEPTKRAWASTIAPTPAGKAARRLATGAAG